MTLLSYKKIIICLGVVENLQNLMGRPDPNMGSNTTTKNKEEKESDDSGSKPDDIKIYTGSVR